MQTVFITGIDKGIGAALAKRFLAADYQVIGGSLVGAVDYAHDNLTVQKLDLSSSDSIAACADALTGSDIKIDVMINDAAVLVDEEETHVRTDYLRQTLEINLIGTIDLTERLLPLVADQGHIVNISSAAGSLGGSEQTIEEFAKSSHYPYHYPCYKISKAALNMYTKVLAAALKKDGSSIVVSSVHPGWVQTDMGGPKAPMTVDEAAGHIFDLAVSRPETGCFWYKGEKHAW